MKTDGITGKVSNKISLTDVATHPQSQSLFLCPYLYPALARDDALSCSLVLARGSHGVVQSASYHDRERTSLRLEEEICKMDSTFILNIISILIN